VATSVVDEDIDGLVRSVRAFGEKEIAPRVRDYDADERIPRDILEKMAALDFFGGVVAAEWGGLGLSHVAYARLIEEMSRWDHNIAVVMGNPSGLVGGGIMRFGTREQKERWLRPLARGEIFGSAGVTEPYSGTDVAGMQTTYERDGDGFVLRGAKLWISGLDIASFFVTFATRDRSLRHRGISAFIVPADAPGVLKHPFKNKLSFRPLSTGELVLDEVRLGPEALLGEEGSGFAVAMTAVERGRLSVAARATGMAQACFEDAVSYSREREVFGQEIGRFQMVQQKIADMAVGIQAARLLVRSCAEALDRGDRGRIEASMAKLFAGEVAQRAAIDASQIHGAYGTSHEYRVARYYRDARAFQVVEGVSDIHRVLIAEDALGYRRARNEPAGTTTGAG
jgi:alkylation response protein AidB-like acyl-CoA dehydrogenase